MIDLRGRTLTPELIDAHIHPQQMGFDSRWVSFLPPEIRSIQDMKPRLAETVGKTATTSWIRGICQFQALTDGRMPNREGTSASRAASRSRWRASTRARRTPRVASSSGTPRAT